MFTGIIECLGTVIKIETSGTNRSYFIRSDISNSLKIDQSLSHDGICLTVESIDGGSHKITAIFETIQKTNIGEWKEGHEVNLERAMLLNTRLDGHIVQGHVDTTAICTLRLDRDGSNEYSFRFDPEFSSFLIEKGSVCLNGVSLTAYNVSKDQFTVAIVPYTFIHTNFPQVLEGSKVNIEFDMIGKYVVRLTELGKGNSK